MRESPNVARRVIAMNRRDRHGSLVVILDHLRAPVVLAPLGGGPSTPELAAAVSEAGGFGFLAAGYLTAGELEERVARTRSLTGEPIGVNVFCPGSGASEPTVYRPYLERLRRWAEREGVNVGEPRYSDDDWEAKLELLVRERLPVVSFTFGCPEPGVIRQLQDAGSEVWVTVTSPEEAGLASAAGTDALVVQGAEAGGHRGSFRDSPDVSLCGLLALLSLVQVQVGLPLVASGGIATGAALAATLCAGARAAQIGSGFMLCPEAGTSEVHRTALRGREPTALTRAFTGRLARGIRNRFLNEHSADAPIAYPELHYATAPMRKQAREQGNMDLVNLWAGEAYQLAEETPAAEIIRHLCAEADEALQTAATRLLM